MNASVSTLLEDRARVLSFEGGCNFRDIGGYRTEGEHSVRWGLVYRTGLLSYFTPNDRQPLMDLGVRAICDLRRAEEREREPTRWPDVAAQTLCWRDGERMPTVRAFAANRPNTAAGMFDAMIDLYRALPAWMGERIGGMFTCVANGQTPLVVHCAAGKDRTGVAIAVLLRALGVPRAAVIEDYLLTNEVGDFEQFIRTRHATQLGLADAQHPLLAMPEDVRRVLFSAEVAFLEAALAEIDASPGGLDGYLERSAGVAPAVLKRVRDALIE
jgi:protein-tyrosine phosphatase